jgi:hypothetical protein
MAYTENSTIGALTALGEAPASADMVPIWDASAAATRMATVAELLTNAGGGVQFSTVIASLGSETGSVADGDTLLEALAKVNDRLSNSSGGTVAATVTLSPAVNTSALISSGYSLTGSDSTSLIDWSGTWNTTGTPTLISADVTDTASNASSLLMDLKVGGVSKSSVTKYGSFVGGLSGLSNSPALAFPVSGAYSVGVYSPASYKIQFAMSPGTGSRNNTAAYQGLQFEMTSGTLSWGVSGQDIFMARDAANTLAQRNGANAQESRVYNTYTDASNYERGAFAWRSNSLYIGSEQAGTGSVRNTYITAHGSSMISMLSGQTFFKEHVRSNTSGTKDMGGLGYEWANLWLAQSVIQKETATAPTGVAGKSTIYTEDDGAGKTRLMVIFGTGVAQQIAIEP